MKKVIGILILISVRVIFALPIPDKAIVGYWHNWGYSPNTILLSEISMDYDVIDIAFATPTSPSGSTMQFTPDPGIYPNENDFIADIDYLHDQGKNVIISIGGANDPVALLTPDDIDNFVSSMTSIINTYGFDGIDIDLEGGSVSLDAGDSDFQFPTTAKIVNLIEAITQLTEQNPSLILTTAPETAYVQGGYSTYGGIWGAYLPILHALRNRWDIVHVQHYNTGSLYGGDGNLYDPATADFHVAMADMLLSGFTVDNWGCQIFFEPFAPSQIAIGLPASPSAAGTGYTEPEIVQNALDYLILGNSFNGNYILSNPEGYNDFRGLMTWSVNWDADYEYEFSLSHRPYLDDLSNPVVIPPDNINIQIDDFNVIISWDPSPYDLVSYNIYRDYIHIAETEDTTYCDQYLPVGTYIYGVSCCTVEGESEIVWLDPVTILPPTQAPYNLAINPETGIFSWDLTSTLVIEYNIFLDGSFQGYTSANLWQFENLEPEVEYTAGVQAVYEYGLSDTVEITFCFAGTLTLDASASSPYLINYPNPFNPVTFIEYSLPRSQNMDISIYNFKGELVNTIFKGVADAGKNHGFWDGQNKDGKLCSSGTYYIRINSKDYQEIQKVVLLK